MKIIYISGIDGCGKTTQAKLLVKNLKKNGLDAHYHWFRWEPSLGTLVSVFRNKNVNKVSMKKAFIENENAHEKKWLNFKRKLLVNPIFALLWLNYACTDYYFSYKRWFQEDDVDVIVIDRYVNDFIIDQAVNFDIAPDKTGGIVDNFFLRKFKFPDLNIIIDLPAVEGHRRKCDGTSIFYLEARVKYYRAINGDETFHINGQRDIEFLKAQISEWVCRKLGINQI